MLNRIDVLAQIKDKKTVDQVEEILRRNKRSEETLNKLFMKYCTKACPNIKCGVPIVKVASGCTQI